jgi:hypothetical protein
MAAAICTAALPTPPGGGGDEHGLSSLQPPPVDQGLIGGPAADHQPGRLGEARLAGHGGQAVGRGQRQFGEPATRREQTREHPRAPTAGRSSIGHHDAA